MGRRAQERRKRRERIEQVVKKQILPQLHADELRRQGHNVETALVSTDLAGEGYLVTCGGCGRQARAGFEPPPGKIALCPNCSTGS